MKVLVSGGGGFLGKALSKKLIKEGYEVFSLSRRSYPDLEKMGITYLCADLGDKKKVIEACQGMDGIFHTAALAGYWGKRETYYRTNVLGTENLLEGCMKHGVKKFIYTSSPSVIFHKGDLENADETFPYPSHHLCHYSETKAIAEKKVLEAGKKGDLQTIALRPHLIWGKGDPHLIPRILSRARSGRLHIIGNGENMVDLIHVNNAAGGHLQALEALMGNSELSGSVYFISDDKPVKLWPWINEILGNLGINPVNRKISFKKAWRVGYILEKIYSIFPFAGEPPMTRFVALSLSTHHYFNTSRARKEIGFHTLISPEEGMSEMITSLKRVSGCD